MQTTDQTNPLQALREAAFRLSRPKMAAVLGVPYGELYGCETGGRSVTRRIVAALNAMGHDGEGVKAATRKWMESRATALQGAASTR